MFLYLIKYTLNITKAINKTCGNSIRDFIYESYYKQNRLSKRDNYRSFKRSKKDLLLFVNKLREKAPDPCNAKQRYDSFLKKKNRKSVKQSDIIIYQPKTFQNRNMVDIKQATTEQPKVVDKSSKDEKANSNRSFYSDTRNPELQLNLKILNLQLKVS